tara:strand:- start:253 stop:894 length:642 start_codon:yes stop_codon:yes gene_type:complete
MHDEVDILLGQIRNDTASATVTPSLKPRIVQRMDGTQEESPYMSSPEAKPFAGVDALFNQSVAYQAYKKEKPEHRLILWARLNGHNVKETAALTGYTPQSVTNVCGQPWFQEAFARLSTECGKDQVTTFLQGEVIPALQRVAHLANNGESEAVRLAANKELLDRYLGKATVKVESKLSGSVDSIVYDVAELEKQNSDLQRQLAARGIGQHSRN